MANLKRNMIELVVGVKDGEVETKKYLTSPFLPFSAVYEAVSLNEEIQKFSGTAKEEKELYDKMIAFVADTAYGKEFTREQLESGLHAPQALGTLMDQIMFVAQGVQTDETKKFLEKKN